ncbi:RNA 2',3'-cyclic phosphodiesterase [Candidatus Nanohaloarchaea archaeon]|nr:RNA 2',3'-cyclic phosphodiesterase [Candidatus Nanohaloarchaea archaeon]
MPRVFSAVEIEDEEVLDRLEEIRNEVDQGFKPVPREKMHITLEFFKDIDSQEIQRIKKSMQDTGIEPFTAEIRGLGAFPSRDYIRVIWAGVESGELHELKEDISGHEVSNSNEEEFRPHITLHRVENLDSSGKKEIQQKLDKYSGQKIAEIEVDKVKLFESVLDDDGSRYRELEVKELG